jgi:hypothetical protein
VFNYVDQFSWLRGDHYLKMGIDVRRYQFNGGSSPVNTFLFAGFSTGTPTAGVPFGIVPGYGVADLLLGRPFQAFSFDGNPDGHSRKTEVAAYFQDDWKVTPSLTLNYGVRWEWYGRVTETDDRQSTWNAECNCILVAGVDLPSQLIEDDWNNFAPRLGFAWRPFGTNETVVRGGAGIFYDSEQRHNFFQIANPPFFLSERYQAPVGLTLDDPFPGGAFLAPNALQLDYRDTYYEHWSLSLQHLVAPETVLEVSYLGSHGVKLQRARDANFFIPGLSTPPFAGFGPIRLFEQAANSIYHSLQTRFERRFYDRLSFIASHTWGHSIDDRPADALASLRSFQDHNDPGADRSDSDFDVRHRVTASFLYDLPVTGMGGVVEQLLDGWALNGLVRLQTGRPFTPYLGGTAVHPDVVGGVDPVPDDQGPDNWINAAAFAPPTGPLGNAGRNSLRGPGLQVVDLGVEKSFVAGEDNKLEFRVDFFNAFNHPNFALPDPVFGSPAFGTIGSTVTPAREIQFGLRYDF